VYPKWDENEATIIKECRETKIGVTICAAVYNFYEALSKPEDSSNREDPLRSFRTYNERFAREIKEKIINSITKK
jgi:hypothetical protein